MPRMQLRHPLADRQPIDLLDWKILPRLDRQQMIPELLRDPRRSYAEYEAKRYVRI